MKKTIIISVLLLFSCDPPGDSRLMFENNSSHPIIFTKGPYNGSINDPYTFYDCSPSKFAHTYVEPKEKDGYATSPGGNWETLLPKYPNGTLIFIVYHADSAIKYINDYGCDSLGKRKDLVLKRFDVTVDYLDKNNWTLTYP
ncbi:hypothetical protein [Dyadobacter bucti]|jgi:hypothetical protein|uniref:hypothetical protein n=1 Tax=Dyadobacter bucti TaxID=2572203 RepID=UPI00110872DF|nr:hypothetical protein [Dyadobacter bucti]